MDKQKITMLCQRILKAANEMEVRGENNFAQMLGICQAARQIATEVNKAEEVAQDG